MNEQEKIKLIYKVIKNDFVKEHGLDSYEQLLQSKKENNALTEMQDSYQLLMNYYWDKDGSDEKNIFVAMALAMVFGIVTIPVLPVYVVQKLINEYRLNEVELLKVHELYEILNEKIMNNEFDNELDLISNVLAESKTKKLIRTL